MISVRVYIWLQQRSDFISFHVMRGLGQASGIARFRGSSLFLLKWALPFMGNVPPKSRQRARGEASSSQSPGQLLGKD